MATAALAAVMAAVALAAATDVVEHDMNNHNNLTQENNKEVEGESAECRVYLI